MPGEPGSQPHAHSAHFLSANPFVTVDVTVPSEECAWRWHEGVTKWFVRDTDCFNRSFPNGRIPFFAPIKRGEVPKTIIFKLNFSLCKHYLRPHAPSLSLGALTEGQWCVTAASSHRHGGPSAFIGQVTLGNRRGSNSLHYTHQSQWNVPSSLMLTFFFLMRTVTFLTTVQ